MSDEFDFRQEIQEADWELLEPHHKRKALFILNSPYELLDIGHSMAVDNIEKIKELLDSGDLYRPSEDDIEKWNKEPHQKMANFLIVSPYVLAKLIIIQ